MVAHSAAILGLAVQASFLASFCRPFSFSTTAGRVGVSVVPRRRGGALSTPTSLQSQILDFVEPTTGVNVKLIGKFAF